MSVLTSLGILILSMLILAFLQLVPGIFALFSHHVSGKYSRLKASDLTIFFIVGAETAITLILLTIYVVLANSALLAYVTTTRCFAWIIAGILAAIGLLILFCYFRKSPGTELFISRRLAQGYQHKITTVKSRSDAFILGFFAALPELIFTLPIFIISTIVIMQIGPDPLARAGLIVLVAICAILPLFIIHSSFAIGHSLADFIKFRFRNKPFFRFCLCFLYLLVALLIVLETLL